MHGDGVIVYGNAGSSIGRQYDWLLLVVAVVYALFWLPIDPCMLIAGRSLFLLVSQTKWFMAFRKLIDPIPTQVP